MGIQLVKGRAFTDQDSEASQKVLIINEAMARRDWPGEDPIGRRICFDREKDQQIWREVVGVVRDVRHIGLEAEPVPQMYLPYLQITTPFTALVLRAANQQSVAEAVRSEILALDRDQPVYNIRPMKQLVAESASRSRFTMLLLALFATLALLLAMMGIYGVMSYSVTERLREIGIRQALGAQVSDVLRLVIGQGMKMTLAGAGIGLAGAFALTRWMKTLLFEVSATDPITFALIPLLLVLVALGACFVPARRATKIDPIHALRYE
jgi:putative ABC transport system permease protein